MKTFFKLLILLSLCACGAHNQDVKTLSPEGVSQEIQAETDPILIISNKINEGDVLGVREVIENGLDINSYNKEGFTFVMLAIRANQFAVLEYLISAGSDLEMRSLDDKKFTAHEFIKNNEKMPDPIKDVFYSILSKAEFDLEVLSSFLFTSVDSRNHFLLKWVLEKGVDPNYVNAESNSTPLIRMFEVGLENEPEIEELKQVFNVLMAHPEIDPSKEVFGATALFWAETQAFFIPAYQYFVNELKNRGA